LNYNIKQFGSELLYFIKWKWMASNLKAWPPLTIHIASQRQYTLTISLNIWQLKINISGYSVISKGVKAFYAKLKFVKVFTIFLYDFYKAERFGLII